jgi:hypothetical protein
VAVNILLSNYIYLEPAESPMRPKHVAPFNIKVTYKFVNTVLLDYDALCYLYTPISLPLITVELKVLSVYDYFMKSSRSQ